jgi:hypothetical protein
MTKVGYLSWMVGILILGACSAPGAPTADLSPLETATVTQTVPAPETRTPTPDIPGISFDQIRNSSYQLGFSDQVRQVQLTDGKYQVGTPGGVEYVSVTMTDSFAGGDLNGDGENEAVAIVGENYGGSGTFVFLVVYQYVNDEPVFLTSTFLDDRPMINGPAVEDGEIFLDAVTHNTDDPMCCPTLETTRHYLLNGVNLILTDYSTKTLSGEPHQITIEAPVDGIQVSGIIRIKGNITISPFENNLVYRVYDLGGVELSAGPVSVESVGLGTPGTFEKAIDLGNILTNTTVRIEVEDINAKDGSLFAMDSVMLVVR